MLDREQVVCVRTVSPLHAKPTEDSADVLTRRSATPAHRYCSGTNWLRQLFNLNCPGLDFKLVSDNAGFELDADGLYGWKHGMFTPDEVETLRQHPEHILVVITKDAFSWAESFWASRTESFEGAPSVSAGYRVLRKNLASTKDTVPASDRNSFERFATMPFATRAGRNAQPRSLDFYNVPTNWTLEADNVIRAREKWAKNIFGAIDQLDNAFHIRYEDLLSDPRCVLGVGWVFWGSTLLPGVLAVEASATGGYRS